MTFQNAKTNSSKIKPLEDETRKVIVNTEGKAGTVSKEQKELLDYLSKGITTGTYTKQLDKAVRQVKASEVRRHEYMIMMIREMEIREEARQEGREEGRKEGKEEGLRDAIIGVVNLLRNLGLSDEIIVRKIMEEYQLTKESAEEIVFQKTAGKVESP